ncbi:MAG: DUF2285 domain-containing protein [Pseudomonadota bacterium]
MAHRSSPFDPFDFDISPYDETLRFPRRAFAWEFVRRHPVASLAYTQQNVCAPIAIALATDTLLVRLKRRFRLAEQLGLFFVPDPRQSARNVVPFWLPRSNPPALVTIERSCRQQRQVGLRDLPGRKQILIPPFGPPHIACSTPVYVGAFSLASDWRTLLEDAQLTVQLAAFDNFDAQLSAARDLFHAYRGDVRSNWSDRSADPKRLRGALIAWDVRAAGGSHWDVAAILFGQDKVTDARRSGDDSLRERARRAYAMAVNYVHGKYRELV